MNQFELLLFQVGPRCYAAEASAIGGILNRLPEGDDRIVTTSKLGTSILKRRGLLVIVNGVEHVLAVDQIVGIRAVRRADLRPVPSIVAGCLGSRAVIGFGLVDEVLTVILDLGLFFEELKPMAPTSSGPGFERTHHA
jgi:hypothetical protein